MLKLDYPAITYYVGTGREVAYLQKNFFRRGLAYPEPYTYQPELTELIKRKGNENLYAFAVRKEWEISCWHKGEAWFVDPIDVSYLLMGELERQTERRKAI